MQNLTEEEKKFLLSEEAVKMVIERFLADERKRHDKAMYYIFKPLYVRIWHKIIGKYPK